MIDRRGHFAWARIVLVTGFRLQITKYSLKMNNETFFENVSTQNMQLMLMLYMICKWTKNELAVRYISSHIYLIFAI